MSPLVKRLRSRDTFTDYNKWLSLLDAAADEIERLEGALGKIEKLTWSEGREPTLPELRHIAFEALNRSLH